MSAMIKPAPVRRTLSVRATPERAFDVFTARFDTWWPRSHSIGAAALKRAVIESGVGGRWYGEDVDGGVALWGDVLAWEPPSRVVLAWRIGADWQYHADLLTEVEVRFSAEAGGTTRVDFEHRLLENMGEAGEGARQQFEQPGGWGGLLQMFVEAAEQA